MSAPPPSHESPPPPALAPSDIYPRDERERALCSAASQPDWLYLGGLVALDAAAVWAGSRDTIKNDGSLAVRMVAPLAIGVTWGATLSGAWLALPKCSPEWAGGAPREGSVHEDWPLALSISLLAGVTAPIVTGIAVGSLPPTWSTFEREMHLVVAGLAGVGGSVLPYVLPPRTWASARVLERLRAGADGRGAYVEYVGRF